MTSRSCTTGGSCPSSRSPSRRAASLAVALIGLDDPAVGVVAEMIVREAGGSPYFVYELVQYLKEGGDLSDSLASFSQINLDSVLWRRITWLPDEAREVLAVLALAGRPVRQSVACRASGQGTEGFASLALLRSNHLVPAGPAPECSTTSRPTTTGSARRS